MEVSVWRIRVNDRTHEFATTTPRIEEALELFKEEYKLKYPYKAFNADGITRINGVTLLTDKKDEV